MNAPPPTPALPAVRERPLPPAALEALQARFGARCTTALAVREQHGRDESAYTHIPPPAAVVYAESTADVADAVRIAAQWRVPVIPFGVGSSLEGHLLAVQGGISLDVSRMNQVLAIQPEDLTATVQPGVTRKQLNEAIRHLGLFFPIDPGADATIGGMAATRASGTNAVRYGTMRDNVLALEVVTASGEVIRTGTRARKSSAGYDLTRLFVGSEGTLGVFTEITVRLYPLPEAVSAAICSFPDVGAAVRTTIAIIQMGSPIARCELLDARTVRAVNAHSKLTLREEPMLLMEFHGSPASVQEQAEAVQAIADEHGGRAFEWATTPEERTRLWTARHNAYFAGVQSRPGCRVITTDACVPISQLADNVLAAVAEADAAGIPYFLVGHVGDGNFHMGYLIDPNDDTERATAERLNHALVARALASGGTCTGEHGVGLHKMGFLRAEVGDGALALMRAIKAALDPHDILNPGKVLLG
ncbi:FAD-binding protein [Tepidimonas taiwanensis]|uniref:FAD-binding oxidoreductase n=1 Tax=Tepidimonas taiwanensis TaxID=307486 RepID=UPI0005BE20E1|nr:FAD-linked oxidase C-terminal domain-containing protein [Tepidimonas taiwanensis]MCX7693949.1 FAD-binding protein [Tepidimonas taiwanensis]MDM7463751.1 FAD-linked oxidase C-terminal domain-containing protein [Tepidimonas taiwanensis]UBQ05301.1 FAD-binding protein [Tepidimonas taiwanensis]